MFTFAPMNGKDEIIKKRLYFEGLKQAIEMPLPEEAIRDVDEILQDDETEESIKETMRLWKEVTGPFGCRGRLYDAPRSLQKLLRFLMTSSVGSTKPTLRKNSSIWMMTSRRKA